MSERVDRRLLMGVMRTDEGVRMLRDYVRKGDEEAFRELVSRYIDMVYSVALRRVGGDVELARDVAQEVFVGLARKAGSLGDLDYLGGWLHRHAGFVASNAVRGESRRRLREKEAMAMHVDAAGSEDLEGVWRELAPVLDEGMDQLEADDRRALMLRYFEKQDFRSVGAALGVSGDAAQKRVNRALEKLRGVLAGRGVTLSAVVLGTCLGQRAVVGAPAGLAGTVSDAALAMGSLATGSVVSTGWGTSVAVKVGGTLALLGTAAWLLMSSWSNSGLENEPADAGPVGAILTGGESTAEPGLGSGDGGGYGARPAGGAGIVSVAGTVTTGDAIEAGALQISVSDAVSGEALAGVQFETWAWVGTKVEKEDGYWSDVAGECGVGVGEDVTRLIVVSHLDGYAETRLEWRRDRGEEVPWA